MPLWLDKEGDYMTLRKRKFVALFIVLLILLTGILYYYFGPSKNAEYQGTFVQTSSKEGIL